MTELRMPGGNATAQIPEDLVPRFVAEGWTVELPPLQPPEPPPPPRHPSPKARAK